MILVTSLMTHSECPPLPPSIPVVHHWMEDVHSLPNNGTTVFLYATIYYQRISSALPSKSPHMMMHAFTSPCFDDQGTWQAWQNVFWYHYSFIFWFESIFGSSKCRWLAQSYQLWPFWQAESVWVFMLLLRIRKQRTFGLKIVRNQRNKLGHRDR